jgi:serine/threonine protein kinase
MSTDPPKPVTAPPSALPPGTRLGEFEVLRILGVGGFGIVYLAFDHALEREVAVKEYMPASLAGRTETLHVSLRSQSDSDTFALGLRSFVNEAKLLARFDHPSLLKVLRFWEANGTAYMAMPVISGRTFKDWRVGMGQPPDEHWLRALLLPLLGAIEKLHSEGVYHRDIAPDNIVIEPDGRPVLLDFGAARRVISDKSQALTAILKPAYAPIEQYAEAGSVKQGPWTDLYALGATLHFMLLGRPPAPATARAVHDSQAPLSGQSLSGCSVEFLHIIDWMLAPRPGDRPQSVAALREVLEGRAAPPVRRSAEAEPQGDWERTAVLPVGSGTRPPPSTIASASPAYPATQPYVEDERTVIRPVQRAVPPPATVAAPPPLPPTPPPPASPPQAASVAPKSGSRLVPALAAAVVIVGAAAFFLWPKPAAVPAAGPVASAPLVASVANAPAEPPPAPPAPAAAPVVVAAASVPALAPASAPVAVKVVPEWGKPAPKPVALPAKHAPAVTVTKAAEPLEPSRTAPVEAPKPAAPPPVVAAAPEPPSAPARLIGPTERCGRRVFVALWTCIERECGKAELKQHPECVKWRAEQEKKARSDAG